MPVLSMMILHVFGKQFNTVTTLSRLYKVHVLQCYVLLNLEADSSSLILFYMCKNDGFYLDFIQISSWNQPELSNKRKVSC